MYKRRAEATKRGARAGLTVSAWDVPQIRQHAVYGPVRDCLRVPPPVTTVTTTHGTITTVLPLTRLRLFRPITPPCCPGHRPIYRPIQYCRLSRVITHTSYGKTDPFVSHQNQNQIEIVIRDYRDVSDVYDAVISIEMLEAVGHEHLPSYFGTVSKALKLGGVCAIQVITCQTPGTRVTAKAKATLYARIFSLGGIYPQSAPWKVPQIALG